MTCNDCFRFCLFWSFVPAGVCLFLYGCMLSFMRFCVPTRRCTCMCDDLDMSQPYCLPDLIHGLCCVSTCFLPALGCDLAQVGSILTYPLIVFPDRPQSLHHNLPNSLLQFPHSPSFNLLCQLLRCSTILVKCRPDDQQIRYARSSLWIKRYTRC